MAFKLYANCTRRSGLGTYAIGDDYLTGTLVGEFPDEDAAYSFAQDQGMLRPCHDDEGGPKFSTLDDMHMLVEMTEPPPFAERGVAVSEAMEAPEWTLRKQLAEAQNDIAQRDKIIRQFEAERDHLRALLDAERDYMARWRTEAILVLSRLNTTMTCGPDPVQ